LRIRRSVNTRVLGPEINEDLRDRFIAHLLRKEERSRIVGLGTIAILAVLAAFTWAGYLAVQEVMDRLYFV
jgi:hypothetical protein